MTDEELLYKLKNAYTICFDCGDKYGQYHDGVSSVWEGKCDICGENKPVTETRDFHYFVTGIRQLNQKLNK